jgi:ribosomal protein L17
MKRIDFIVKGVKGVLEETFSFREKRVRRAVDDAIDNAEEMAFEERRKATETINSIKDVADDKSKIAQKLNEYILHMQDADGYLKTKEYLEKAKVMLDEEVEVELEDSKK